MRNFTIFIVLLLSGLYIHENNANAYSSCLDYGMAIESSPGYCKCMSGYVWGTNYMGEKYCVSGSSACTKQYGYMSEYDSLTGKCGCSRGYGFMTDSFGNTSCERMSKICQKKFGYGSEYDSLNKECDCSYGYVFENTINGYQCVMANCGLYGRFNDYTKTCDCNKGYTFKDGSCKKSSISQYFTLKEVNDYNNEAIVYSTYAGYNTYFKIGFGYGCNNIGNYIGNFVVLNLMYDGVLNYNDYLVLQDDDEACIINSVEQTNSSETYLTCEDIFGVNSIELPSGKCTCKTGYKWSNDKKSCISKCKSGKVNKSGKCI